MATLTATIQSVGASLKAKGHNSQKAFDEGESAILDKAESIKDDRVSLGDAAAARLFGSLEGSLKVFMKASALQKAQDAALGALASALADDASPADVQKAFHATVAERLGGAEDEEALERDYEPLKKLRKLVRDSDKAAGRRGAGGSSAEAGGDDDDELGEDGIAMTQAARSTKCVLTQLEMTASGEMRPVKAPCGHCFSYKGIRAQCQKGPTECPQAGCKRTVRLAELVDDKELIKEIKKKAR